MRFYLDLYLVFTSLALICNPLWWLCCWNNPNLLPIPYPVGKDEAVIWLMAKTVNYSKAGTLVDFDEAVIWWQTRIKTNKFSQNLELDCSNIILRKILQDRLCASWERLSLFLFQWWPFLPWCWWNVSRWDRMQVLYGWKWMLSGISGGRWNNVQQFDYFFF